MRSTRSTTPGPGRGHRTSRARAAAASLTVAAALVSALVAGHGTPADPALPSLSEGSAVGAATAPPSDDVSRRAAAQIADAPSSGSTTATATADALESTGETSLGTDGATPRTVAESGAPGASVGTTSPRAVAPATAAGPSGAGPSVGGPTTTTAPTMTSQPGPAVPAAPAPGVVTGTLTRAWAEAARVPDDHAADDHAADDDDDATLLAWVETDDDAYPLTPADVRTVEDGSTVTVELAAAGARGTHPARVLDVEGPVATAGGLLYGEGSQDVFGVAAASVQHEVTVVLAVPRGATRDGMAPATLAGVVDGGVDAFWSQQTRGQRGFRVVATHGWQDLTSTCTDSTALWKEVASRVGFVAGARRHLLVYLPPSAGCGAGLGTVGSPDAGGRSWVGYATTSIIAHELGHNLGLGHSNGLLCSDASDGQWSGTAWQAGCTAQDYRDYYDVMGISWENLGSLAAPQADALGVLRSTDKLAVTTPVRVRLVPASSEGLRVLRIDDPAGGAYFVEYRTPTGWDGWLTGNHRGLDTGVLVHRTSPARAREILLLDGSVTPGNRSDDWAASLQAGTSMTTASGSTRVVVEEVGSSGATVAVWRDGVGPAAVEPPAGGAQVEVQSPTTSAVAPGTTVFSGVATAPEGTLHWEVVEGGVVRGSGTAQTGANGAFETFQVPVSLPAGSYLFRVTVPDYSDDEDPTPTGMVDELALTVR